MAPVGSFAFFLIAACVVYMAPKQYESEGMIQLNPPITDAPMHSVGNADRMIATEVEIINSRVLLAMTADSLKLPEKWAMSQDETIQKLATAITVSGVRGTDIVSIRARDVSPATARDIAAAVIETYIAYRSEDTDDKIKVISEAVREQENKVEKARKALAKATENANLSDNPADLQNNSAYLDAKSRFESENDLLNTLKLKQIAETISPKIPRETVTIHMEPMGSAIPVAPNVSLYLVGGLVVGFIITPILTLLVMVVINERAKSRKARD